MITKILLGLVILLAVLATVIALRPSQFRVTRTATIPAPPTVVFEQVNDLHRWQAWSPWAKMDPASKITFEGPAAGQGSSFAWSGNQEVGEGRMTILESRPKEMVRFKLEFKKPFEGTNDAGFTFRPEGGQTAVTWTMSGTNNFLFKAAGLFMDCDQMVGSQFEQGLANLQAVSTSPASASR